MNVITNSDVKKFLKLLKAGLKNGSSKEMRIYTSGTKFDGTDVVKDYYVSLGFKFKVNREVIDELFAEEDFDASSELKELLDGI